MPKNWISTQDHAKKNEKNINVHSKNLPIQEPTPHVLWVVWYNKNSVKWHYDVYSLLVKFDFTYYYLTVSWI